MRASVRRGISIDVNLSIWITSNKQVQGAADTIVKYIAGFIPNPIVHLIKMKSQDIR